MTYWAALEAWYWRWYANLELAIIYAPRAARYPRGRWHG